MHLSIAAADRQHSPAICARKATMDVLIVSVNRVNQPMATTPYGACIVAESLIRKGHRVHLLDLMFEHDPHRALTLALERHSPDIVGVAVRNIDNNDMQHPAEYYRDVSCIVEITRKGTSAPVVLGGAAVGVMPEALLRYSGADLAVLRDGESVFPRIIESLSDGGCLSDIQNVAWIENGRFHENGDANSALENDIIAPDFHRWLNIKAYQSAMATIPIQSKRGCPFDCVYCTYGISEGKSYRLHPPDEVADAVSWLVADGFRDIEFVDNVFNSPYDHAMAICERLAEKRCGARLLSMEINPRFLDDRLLATMERAGFSGIGITAESADDTVLARLGKGYDASHVQQAAAMIKNHSLPCFWIFMLGGPGETRSSIARTLHFAKRVLRPKDVAFFNIGIRIYPGTGLEGIARESGQLQAEGLDMLKPVFYFSPEVDFEWLLEELRQTMRAHLNMLDAAALSHPWLPAINRLANQLPIRRPLWKHTAKIRKIIRLFGKDMGTIPNGRGREHV